MTGAVAITGVGQVSALGPDVAALAAGVREGRCGIGPLTLFTHRGRSAVAAELASLPSLDVAFPSAVARRLSRSDRMALAAAGEASRMAGLDESLREAAAVCVGTTTAGMLGTEEEFRRWRAGEHRRIRYSQFAGMPLSTVGSAVSQALGMFGPRVTVSTACSSGALAIAAAAGVVLRGEAPVAIALGVDSLCRLTYAGFDALQALDPSPCRPFDCERRGLSLGEGAGALVLERADHAIARGATIYARLAGAGITSDGYDIVQPHPEGAGAIRAIARAIADAGIDRSDIKHVNAHATSTPVGDMAEVAALLAAVGDHPVLTSTKSMSGHLLGAAGALESIATILAIRDGVVPPTINLDDPDDALTLDVAAHKARQLDIPAALNNSFGFGGHNVALVFARA